MSAPYKKVEVWQTEDGTYHTSEEMALQYSLFNAVCKSLESVVGVEHPHNVVNWITDHKADVRALLDASDLLEKKVMS